MELRAEGEGDKMVVVSAKTSGYIGGGVSCSERSLPSKRVSTPFCLCDRMLPIPRGFL
jgi:hypothetical protein